MAGHRTRAFTITECLVALVLLAAAAALMAQMLGGVAQQRRAADQQSLALQETANLMEQLFAMPYAELTPERAADLPCPNWPGTACPPLGWTLRSLPARMNRRQKKSAWPSAGSTVAANTEFRCS